MVGDSSLPNDAFLSNGNSFLYRGRARTRRADRGRGWLRVAARGRPRGLEAVVARSHGALIAGGGGRDVDG